MAELRLVALLFADRVAREDTGKMSISGTFTYFFTPVVPISFAPWFLYASVLGSVGPHSYAFRLIQNETNLTLFDLPGTFKIESEIFGVEIGMPIFSCVFPKYGEYEVQLLVDNVCIGSRKLPILAEQINFGAKK